MESPGEKRNPERVTPVPATAARAEPDLDALKAIDVATVRRAEDYASRIAAVFDGPSGARASASAVGVLVKALAGCLKQFEGDWLDRPTDRLQAMLNMSRSLDASAHELHASVVLMIAMVLEHRGLLHDRPEDIPDETIASLVAEIANELTSMVSGEEPSRPGAGGGR
jgi:hypothetical protein